MSHSNNNTTYLGIKSREVLLVKKFASQWFLNLMYIVPEYDDYFFECAGYLAGSMKQLAKNIISDIKKYNTGIQLKSKKIPTSLLKNLENCAPRLIADNIDDIIEDNPPYIRNVIFESIKEAVVTNISIEAKLTDRNSMVHQLKKLFGLDAKSLELCFFVFASSNFDALENYFHNSLNLFQYENSQMLAAMLKMEDSKCKGARYNLEAMGIIESWHRIPRLSNEIEKSIKGIGSKSLKSRLCAPVGTCEIPIYDFNIPNEAIDHIIRLLKIKHSEPCNIIVFGKPGLGKSTFVRALAATLNVKAFEVMSNHEDSTSSRRAALTAALNMASRHEGAFVLVDEAEDLLHTSSLDFEHGTKKSWLAGLLETRGNRIIWICNTVRHLDPAIKRRFAYSVKFPELSKSEQIKIWSNTAKRLHVEKKLPEEEIKQLVNCFHVPVSCMDSSIRLAKAVATKKGFVDHIKRSLKAYSILLYDGEDTINRQPELEDCVLDGICTSMPVQEFLDRMRRIDQCLKSSEKSRPGMGTVLFYGKSGSGKSHMAKYVAKMLERPCLIKRPDSLLSKYVGGTEGLIHDAFQEAERDDSILILDECDSIILGREGAEHSWEISQTNEFLTCLEEYKGIAILTTNFRKILDSALMRRMSIKIEFKYAQPHQLVCLYNQILAPLVQGEPTQHELDFLQSHRHLCVGDFNNVKNQFWIEDSKKLSHKMLLDALANEERLKIETGSKRLGFAV